MDGLKLHMGQSGLEERWGPQFSQKVPLLRLRCTYNICIFINMNIVWEPKKAKTNFLKHQIRFSDAELVLFDPLALSREDEDTEGERRFVSM